MWKAVVGKVDVDANQEFAVRSKSIPTVLIFQKTWRSSYR
jgi:thioredoxin-like negative regulator of GroEL